MQSNFIYMTMSIIIDAKCILGRMSRSMCLSESLIFGPMPPDDHVLTEHAQ